MTTNTRSSPAVWLVGKGTKLLSSSRLSTTGDVLRCLLYHHQDKHRNVKESIHFTIVELLEIWKKARIPTQRIDSAERKLKKLYDEYQLLKKNRTTSLESCRVKEHSFKDDLQKLFDISPKNVMEIITDPEDKQFLIMQRTGVTSCSMAGVDRNLLQKETRKRAREEANDRRKLNEAERSQQLEAHGDLVEILASTSTSSEGSDIGDDDTDMDFRVSSSVHKSRSTKKTKHMRSAKNIITSPEVAGALDRVNLPDRGAMFVVASVAKALGHPLDDLALSRSTIRRSRMAIRKEAAEADKDSFNVECPLLLHWDGKMLLDIAGAKETVDRIAVVVTGNGTEKLLAVPKIGKGTGSEQAAACIAVLDEWEIRDAVHGLVFDTTASNTGIHTGTCVIIEKILGRELVNIGCRHHILEVILGSVFTALFGGKGGPQVGLFKRFQKKWPFIQQTDYMPAEDELFNSVTEILRKEMVTFYTNAITCQQPREDYLELLRLCLIYLGGGSAGTDITFRAPGAMHHARWMAKAIYSLKMVLFKGQLTLTARERKGLTELALFVALIYGRFWHEAPLASHAPLNDAQMLQLLQTYPNRTVADAAYTALSRHLWFFSEHLVGLAFFDPRVDLCVKKAMAANLHLPKTPSALHRVDASTADFNNLETFVTERTNRLFELLSTTGLEESRSFLSKDPEAWEAEASYQKLCQRVKMLKVVNDGAESGIALIEKYNQSLTKNEEQKQFLLRFVQNHRQKFPSSSKAELAT